MPIKRFYFIVSIFTLITSLSLCISPALAYTPTPEEKKFLLQVEKDSVNYFVRFSDPKTALVRDSSRNGSPASIASTGFGLAVWAIAKERGWLSYQESYNLIIKCLRTLRDKVEHKNGFFYHMVSAYSGKRIWNSEASSIDTALVVAGALYAGEVFKGTEAQRIAKQLYERVDWKWMMNHTDLICHGWKPESGFLPYYWDMYSEHLILQALALGSPTHPIPVSEWNEWDRDESEYNGKNVVYSFTGSLFTYQYSHAFIDFRNLWDRDINYFENSKNATLVNQEYCLDNRESFPTSYSELSWGLSACLGPHGYRAYGALPGQAVHDGTIAVYASSSSIPFAPEITIKTLKNIYDKYKEKLYSRYGFKDSYNLEKNWFAQEMLGIDQGIMILMIENFLSESIWNRFMKLKPIQIWIQRCKLNGQITSSSSIDRSGFLPSTSTPSSADSRMRVTLPNY